jgi:cytochrome c oxidase subunit 2
VCAGCSGNQAIFNPQGPAARSIATLGWTLLAISGVVYVLVMLALIWALARRRGVHDDAPATTRALTRTVTLAAGATVIVLVVLSVVSVVAGRGLTSPSGPGALQVEVIGHQWWWDFQYTDVTPSDYVNSPNELHIPVGVPVVLKVRSQDVIHSFWVPNLHGKRDLIPGQITHTWIQADVQVCIGGSARSSAVTSTRAWPSPLLPSPWTHFSSGSRTSDSPPPNPRRTSSDTVAMSFCSPRA